MTADACAPAEEAASRTEPMMWDVADAPPTPDSPLEVVPGVVLVLAPNANAWTFEGTNTWLVFGRYGAAVVDPGPDDSEHLDRIDAVVRAHGSRVTDVLLTHHHGDHSQAASAVASRWRAAISPRVQRGLIPDGTTFDLGGVTLRAHETPGHTADGISFALDHRRLLITGDTVLARVNPFISHPDGTVADFLRSLDRVAQLVDDDWTLLPGHGPFVAEPRRYVRRRIADRLRRIDQIAGHLERGVPRGELADLVYAKVDGGRKPAAEASVAAILHYLDSRDAESRKRGGRQ